MQKSNDFKLEWQQNLRFSVGLTTCMKDALDLHPFPLSCPILFPTFVVDSHFQPSAKRLLSNGKGKAFISMEKKEKPSCFILNIHRTVHLDFICYFYLIPLMTVTVVFQHDNGVEKGSQSNIMQHPGFSSPYIYYCISNKYFPKTQCHNI